MRLILAVILSSLASFTLAEEEVKDVFTLGYESAFCESAEFLSCAGTTYQKCVVAVSESTSGCDFSQLYQSIESATELSSPQIKLAQEQFGKCFYNSFSNELGSVDVKVSNCINSALVAQKNKVLKQYKGIK